MERILALMHETTLDPDRWPCAAGLIDEMLGTHGFSFAYGGGHSEEDVRIHSSGYFVGGQRRIETEREYFEVYHPGDERLPRLRRMTDGRLCHLPDLYTEAERKSSATYNEIAVRTHGQDSVNVCLKGLRGAHVTLQFHDPVDGGGWSSERLGTIRALRPHLRQAVAVQHELAIAGALGAMLSGMLEATGLGIVQLDAQGRIVAANDRALGVLRAGDGLFDEGGQLFAREAEDDAGLQALLGRALPPFGAGGTGGSTLASRPGDRPPLVLHVIPSGGRKAESTAWPVAALVLVVDPADGVAVDPAAVGAVLGLTLSEARVAVQLAQGLSVREIAAATRRGESTIRWHVKQTFAKLGLSRQMQLVTLVRSLAGTPQAAKQPRPLRDQGSRATGSGIRRAGGAHSVNRRENDRRHDAACRGNDT